MPEIPVGELDIVTASTTPQRLFADRVSSCGITWTFEKEHEIGFFVDGSPWVKGPVKIIDIDPPTRRMNYPGSTIEVDINGTVIDPKAYTDYQGWDELAGMAAGHQTNQPSYFASIHYPTDTHAPHNLGFNGNAGLYLPLTIDGDNRGTSVVSCESHNIIEGHSEKSESRIKRVGILTVYPTDQTVLTGSNSGAMSGVAYPDTNDFRPPYSKPQANSAPYVFNLTGCLEDKLHRSGLFVTPTGIPNITGLASSFSCIRLESAMVGQRNSPGVVYNTTNRHLLYNSAQTYSDGRDIANAIGQAALIYHASGSLGTDLGVSGWDVKDPAFRDLKIGVVQRGIDTLGICEQLMSGGAGGGGTATYQPSVPFGAMYGPMSNQGRLFELLFAGYLLSGNHANGAGERLYTASSGFMWQEDQQTFEIDAYTPFIGQNYTTGMTGLKEWGVKHSGAPHLDNADFASPSQFESERASTVGSWWAQTLGARVCQMYPRALGGPIWNDDDYFGYMERHQGFSTGVTTRNTSGDGGFGAAVTDRDMTWDTWSKHMWDKHRTDH